MKHYSVSDRYPIPHRDGIHIRYYTFNHQSSLINKVILDFCIFQILPRITAPYQTDELAPILTLPITAAVDAIKQPFSSGILLPSFTARNEGCTKCNRYIKIIKNLKMNLIVFE